MTEHPEAIRAGPALEIKSEVSSRVLHLGESCVIGRDPRADIVFADPRVSWRHALVTSQDGRWILEDFGSQNGVFVERQRLQRVELDSERVVRLANPSSGPLLRCSVSTAPAAVRAETESPGALSVDVRPVSPAPAALRAETESPGALSVDVRPSAVRPAPTGPVRIGRSPENEIVVDDLSASRHHAQLRALGDGRYEVIDLSSRNGTFVNGVRVTRAIVTGHDIIGVGNTTFRVDRHQLREFVDAGDVSVAARNLTVRLSSSRVLLDDVSFSLGQRSLAAIIGPSGAGKSTLLGALTATRRATAGTVLYDNRDLYANYAELRQRIGLVPQENILHPQLSALRALDYAAQLRFPRDISEAERRGRVDEVLEELGLRAHRDTRIAKLSGGQQKRVNVALELLTKPSLLFLDEPTSGLDPGLDKSVMQLMKSLSQERRTVIVVTHAVANLDLCDRVLILAPGGRLAFCGPPAEALEHFGAHDWADVFQTFAAQADRDSEAAFARSGHQPSDLPRGFDAR